jgi:outer membrane protein assembly factor BamA
MVKVQPDERFEVRTRAGFAMQQVSKQFSFYKMTYRAGGSFWIKNPFNCGDKLGLDVDASFAERKLVAEYGRPWLGSIPMDTVVQVYSNQFQQPGAVGTRKNLYEVSQTGTLFGLRKEHQYINTGGNIGFEWMETKVSDREIFADRVARAINFEPYLLDKKIPYFTFEPSVTVDYVDNRLAPKKGVFVLYSIKGMIPMGRLSLNGYFVRMLLEQSFYLPLNPVVLAFRVRLGHIFHKDFSSIMPSERFYLGGANSIRGYERDLAPPLGVFHDEKRGPQYVPQGGKSMFNIILEARFPIYKRFGLALFEDIGALSGHTFNDFWERGVLSATGFGLRFETPIGPLRFDLGWRWKATDPVRPSYAWFLTLGEAF